MTKVSFCGISGSGMSALAQILKLRGNEVYGSDRSFDQGKDQANKKALEEIGIVIKPQDGSAVADDLETLYVSTAVEDSIPDVKAALEKNVPIKKRSDLLAEIFHQYPYNIAVGGTSGKTTTTAMIGYILDTLGKKPCVINGGLLLNYTAKAFPTSFTIRETFASSKPTKATVQLKNITHMSRLSTTLPSTTNRLKNFVSFLPTSPGAPAAVSLSMPTAKPARTSAARTKTI